MSKRRGIRHVCARTAGDPRGVLSSYLSLALRPAVCEFERSLWCEVKQETPLSSNEICTYAMDATALELSRARAIKAAAKDAGLSTVSDFEYLQHAIVAKDKVQHALKRMRRMEEFRARYKIDGEGNVDEAFRLFHRFEDEFPGFFVGIGRDQHGRAVQMCEHGRFDPSKLKSEDDWRCLMVCMYYTFTALQPNVEAVRNGMLFLADAKGSGLRNYSPEFQQRSLDFYQNSYPARLEKIAILDAPVIVRFLGMVVDPFARALRTC